MESTWFVARNNNHKTGPFSLAQLQSLAASGKLRPGDMVLQSGAGKWVPVNSVAGVFPAASHVSPSLASAAPQGDSLLGRAPDAHARPAIPSVIPPELLNHPEYEDIVELSHGGMGVVYVARQRLMNRHDALKLIHQSLLDEPGATERFLREIQAAATLDHLNIVKAYFAFEAGRRLVFVMEYVPGENLGRLVKRVGPLPVPNACGYAQQVARGLQHAFEKGLVHRDINPQNIMLTACGIKPHIKHVVKILDFGLAKARKPGATRLGKTRIGSLLGTPHYIAPEQIEDAARADIRADVYSLGCTLYFLLTGAPPFDGASEIDLLDAHRRDKPRSVQAVRPEVPGELAAIIDRLLLKKPADRYQTPGEVAEVLSPFLKGGIKAIRLLESPPTPTPKQAEPRRGEPLRPTIAEGLRLGGVLASDRASASAPIPPTAFEKRGGSATMDGGQSKPLPPPLPSPPNGKPGDKPAHTSRGSLRRFLKVFAGAILAIGILAAVGGYFEFERRKAQEQARLADEAKREAERKEKEANARADEAKREAASVAMRNAGGPSLPAPLAPPPVLELPNPVVLAQRYDYNALSDSNVIATVQNSGAAGNVRVIVDVYKDQACTQLINSFFSVIFFLGKGEQQEVVIRLYGVQEGISGVYYRTGAVPFFPPPDL